jgi:hypothetical protein
MPPDRCADFGVVNKNLFSNGFELLGHISPSFLNVYPLALTPMLHLGQFRFVDQHHAGIEIPWFDPAFDHKLPNASGCHLQALCGLSRRKFHTEHPSYMAMVSQAKNQVYITPVKHREGACNVKRWNATSQRYNPSMRLQERGISRLYRPVSISV